MSGRCEVRGEILVFHDGNFQKDKQLFDSIKSTTFDNLVLPGSLKQQIQNDFQQFLESREVYEQYKIPWKRGAIFIGPPGNGKTHTLKALVNQLGKPCLYVRSFKSERRTEQENIGEVFKRARMTTPSIVVLEDLDSMIDNKNRSFFLNELDGFRANTGVIVLATTNHPEKTGPFDSRSAEPFRPQVLLSVAGGSGTASIHCEVERGAPAGIACIEKWG